MNRKKWKHNPENGSILTWKRKSGIGRIHRLFSLLMKITERSFLQLSSFQSDAESIFLFFDPHHKRGLPLPGQGRCDSQVASNYSYNNGNQRFQPSEKQRSHSWNRVRRRWQGKQGGDPRWSSSEWADSLFKQIQGFSWVYCLRSDGRRQDDPSVP